MIGRTGFTSAERRKSILRSVTEALEQIERCAELAGDNQEIQALLDRAGDALRRAAGEVRNGMVPLVDLLLDGRDLKGSLERLVVYARQVLGLPIESRIEDGVGAVLPPARAIHVLHVVQEALCNTILHANASRVALRAAVENHRLVVRLSDDGCGFDVKAARASGRGGLALMQQRADAAGCMLQVESAPGVGTIVTLTVPLE